MQNRLLHFWYYSLKRLYLFQALDYRICLFTVMKSYFHNDYLQIFYLTNKKSMIFCLSTVLYTKLHKNQSCAKSWCCASCTKRFSAVLSCRKAFLSIFERFFNFLRLGSQVLPKRKNWTDLSFVELQKFSTPYFKKN